MRRCIHEFLGRVGYREAAALQVECSRHLKDGAGPERLLLLEHPPVITLGRNARAEDVLLDTRALAARGIAVERCDRGGQVTYHGPGQLVGYPILDLSPDRRDVARYLRDLEEVLIRTLGRFAVESFRRPGLTGVWVEAGKIAALGVHLSRWVTTHGFALNVSTDLRQYDFIVPCGLRGGGIASMQGLLGRPVALAEVADIVVREFAQVFGRDMAPATAADDRPAAAIPAAPLVEAC